MEHGRVVAVEGPDGPGSGYVIAGRLVLTSAHGVPGEGQAVTLFRPGRPERWQGTVVWRGSPSGRDDAALIHLADPAWLPPSGPAVRWGRLVTDRPGTPCEAWGIPELVQRPGRATDTLQPSGTLNPGDRQVGNRYVMNLDHHPPAATDDGASPWGGLSGAALFCGDLLAGVITSDPAGRSHAHLEAVPAFVLLHDAAFRAALTAHGPTGTELEPVEWQHLAEPATAAGLVRSPAALLRARRQIVPFRGRTPDLDRLAAWSSEPGFGALLLHGSGGQGKTRLAQHFADQLAAQRWTVLWLRADTGPDTLAVLAAAAVPVLVVVDYAENRPLQLEALLQAAARHPGASPFKLLLLARTAGDWWPALQASSPTAEDLLDGARVIALHALEPDSGRSRREAYQEAVHAYASHLPQVRGWQDFDWVTLAHRLTSNPRPEPLAGLDRPGLETALSLHMTALADLLDTASQPFSDGRAPVQAETTTTDTTDVEDRLLVHERRYWTTAATTHALHPALTQATLTDALAAAFLLGADDRDQADVLLDRVPGLAGQLPDRRRAVRNWIAALYPPATHSWPWDTLQPDRLAERFLGRHLHTDPRLADHLIVGATAHQATRLLTVYTRAAAHTVFHHQLDQHLTALCVRHADLLATPAIEVATQTEAPHPLLDALQQITDQPDIQLSDLEQLEAKLPSTSHNLAPWAAHLTRRITEHYRTLPHDDPDRLPRVAGSLNDLSIRLAALGRREEALAATTESVEIYQELAQMRPDAFRPDLATSLNNHSNQLSALGRREEALAATTESVEIYQELAQMRPAAFLPHLAASLNNHSVQLSALGRRGEALAASIEAVVVYQELAQVRPDAFRPDLAASLNNLSIWLAAVGRREEALAATTEALGIRRELARARPDAFRPDLALSLNNLSIWLAVLGRREEALAAITEAVEAYRELARARPDVHQHELDRSLQVLAWLQKHVEGGSDSTT
ncbi:tetratricopeptide repeat protein [Streptomyces sp. NPDC005485]|uniref:tetratricopeptide repeat protein n=1 Tax=Streptomyces sp. NPDC005485 TaxID=3155591 RepID=UPI0033BDEF82